MSGALDRDARGSAGAAVAVILRPTEGDLELLFIRRPDRDGDPWSGDLAFPGGLAREGEDAAGAARREAFEEVRLRLGEPIGRLDDRITAHPRRARPMRVRPIVFVTRERELAPDPREVAEAFWVPLSRLARLPVVPALRRVRGVPVIVPAMDLDGRTLWGLTLAMVRELCADEICTARGRARIIEA
ncbi:MAG: CoA pyrophosphatase [Sandaracinaceae bacterium]|nr:CoA pyrophosphatase [Sandaracinaceae bacterium]